MAAALTLRKLTAGTDNEVSVFLFECKRFGEHHNQCLGVLSPPLLSILKDYLGIELPGSLVQRNIRGYVLAAASGEVTLDCPTASDASQAVRRVQFDSFLLSKVQEQGVSLVCSRVSDVEITPDGVTVYSDSGNWKVDAIVGAFGLDRAMADVFRKRTKYRPPVAIETLVTKIHPGGLDRVEGLLSDRIYAYLPRIRGIEFGALVPKGNHISVVVAGKNIRSSDMDQFLALPEVSRMLPSGRPKSGYFKGSFPLGLAAGIFGDRYVMVGDAAGLVRPFKGKGINTAILTGQLAASTIVRHGVSAEALSTFYAGCRELRADVMYGRLMRALAIGTASYLSMERVIALARKDGEVRQALFDCVSGNRYFRQIVKGHMSPRFVGRVLRATLVEGLADRVSGKVG